MHCATSLSNYAFFIARIKGLKVSFVTMSCIQAISAVVCNTCPFTFYQLCTSDTHCIAPQC